MSSADPIQVGVLGYGPAGVIHAALIQAADSMTVKRIATTAPSRVELANERHPRATISRPHECLDDPDIELLVVATPNETHHELASAALKAGKHVVIDKPFTVTSAEATQLIETANHVDRLVVPFHNRRWDSDFLTLQQCLADDGIGEVRTFISRYDISRPVTDGWREVEGPGAGLLYDIGAHLVDQALVLFGQPTAVTAHVATVRPRAVTDDFFNVVLCYPATLVILQSSLMVRGNVPRFEAHGTNGTFMKYGFDGQFRALLDGHKVTDSEFGIEPSDLRTTVTTDVVTQLESARGAYAHFYESLGDSIRHKSPPPVEAVDGLRTVHIIEAAHMSAREGRSVAL